MTLPLDGLLVLDMAQFLSGPSAALRLRDLGARVVKIERPKGGDICRSLYLTDTEVAGDSTLFHAINRDKESFAADLKNPEDLAAVKALIACADVVIQNFRPGVADRLGVGWDAARKLNQRLIHASISGYGEAGPWAALPGQDLLAQAVSGVMWLNGSEGDGPVPFGLSVADMLAGHILTEGILAALVRRGVTGEGTRVQTSLLEALLDLQFEVLTTHLSGDRRLPARSAERNAHAYLAAPYGVYQTADGWLALAMTPLDRIAGLLELAPLAAIAAEPNGAFDKRDEAKRAIAKRLLDRSTDEWLALLRSEDIWSAPVMDWPTLLETDAFRRLEMLGTLERDGSRIVTTRAPVRIDGSRAELGDAAPRVGRDTAALRREFGLERRDRMSSDDKDG